MQYPHLNDEEDVPGKN